MNEQTRRNVHNVGAYRYYFGTIAANRRSSRSGPAGFVAYLMAVGARL